MSAYRKIDTKMWNDEKFRPLSDDSKLAFVFLLTHPHMTALGAMRATLPGLAAELGWTSKRFRTAVTPLRSKGMIEVNEPACFVAIPKFLRYNKPGGPNSVVGAWPHAASLIPECPERKQLISRCRAYLDGQSEKFRSALGDVMSDAMWGAMPDAMSHGMSDAILDAKSDPCPIQEQEHKQEQDKDTPPAASSSFEEFWGLYPMRNGRRKYKEKAAKLWNRLSEKDKPLVLLAARHLKASKDVADGIGIKDAHRWLRDGNQEPWRDYVDPERALPRNGHAVVLTCKKQIQNPNDRFGRPCGQPATWDPNVKEARCAEHHTLDIKVLAC